MTIPEQTMKTLFLATLAVVLVSACSSRNDDSSQTDTTGTESGMTVLPDTYANSTYGVSLRMPQSWIALEEPNAAARLFAINVFPPNRGVETQTPLNVHADANLTYLAIWPEGIGTELPTGHRKSFAEKPPAFPIQFDVNAAESLVYYLKDGTPWAFFIVPANPPANWQNGFVFAQVGVRNFSTTCYDGKTSELKDPAQCDPLLGDSLVRGGKPIEEEGRHIRQILSSLELAEAGGTATAQEPPAVDAMDLEHPLPNAEVRSPLTVEGKARGTWFFEGSLPVKLYDANGNQLAAGNAKARGNWMTEGYVPFSVTLRFQAPDDERGKLVFSKANPSGLPRNDDSFTQPVIFPPQ
jgi:hypothetical protein